MQGRQFVDSLKSAGNGPIHSPVSNPIKIKPNQKRSKQTNKKHTTTTKPNQTEHRGVGSLLAMGITCMMTSVCHHSCSNEQTTPPLMAKLCSRLQNTLRAVSRGSLTLKLPSAKFASCIFDGCTISASYEVSQAQKAILLLPHTAKGASTSSEELNAQISPRTDDEYNLPTHEDQLQEH